MFGPIVNLNLSLPLQITSKHSGSLWGGLELVYPGM